jgi:hypothetical protein
MCLRKIILRLAEIACVEAMQSLLSSAAQLKNLSVLVGIVNSNKKSQKT